jgi:hypothetical protein
VLAPFQLAQRLAQTRIKEQAKPAHAQAELDAKAQAAADETERQVLRGAYLDLKNGTGTQAERLRRVERAAAWLLRQYVQQ